MDFLFPCLGSCAGVILFLMFVFFMIFGFKMGSLRLGRCLKSFLEVLRFVVTEYRAVEATGTRFVTKIVV